MDSKAGITQLLSLWREGDQRALEELTPLVYAELRRLAQHYVSGEKRGHILQPTALVNEAFLRLMEWQPDQWQNRAHFFGVSAGMMRRILVQLAREGATTKRGGQAIQVSFAEGMDSGATTTRLDDDLALLDTELTNLEALSPRQARIVEMRFFSGLSFEEVAAVMDVSLSTVRREWRIARAWLRERLSSQR